MEEKQVIKISEILEDLENGLCRADIRAKYSLTNRELSSLFKHPKLKSKRAKKSIEDSFILVDDEVATIPPIEEDTSSVEENTSSVADTVEITKETLSFSLEDQHASKENNEEEPQTLQREYLTPSLDNPFA